MGQSRRISLIWDATRDVRLCVPICKLPGRPRGSISGRREQAPPRYQAYLWSPQDSGEVYATRGTVP